MKIDKELCNQLVSYLKENSNRFVSKSEIIENIDGFKTHVKSSTSHDECSYIWTCKNYINNNVQEFGVIIIANSKGDIKIPNEQEARNEIERQMKINKRRLVRTYNLHKSLKLNGQGTLEGFIYETISRD